MADSRHPNTKHKPINSNLNQMNELEQKAADTILNRIVELSPEQSGPLVVAYSNLLQAVYQRLQLDNQKRMIEQRDLEEQSPKQVPA